jgi:hypothetical protein
MNDLFSSQNIGWFCGLAVVITTGILIPLLKLAKKKDVYKENGDNKFMTIESCKEEKDACNAHRSGIRDLTFKQYEKDAKEQEKETHNKLNGVEIEILDIKDFRRKTDERMMHFETSVVNMNQRIANFQADFREQMLEFRKELFKDHSDNITKLNRTIETKFGELIDAFIDAQNAAKAGPH